MTRGTRRACAWVVAMLMPAAVAAASTGSFVWFKAAAAPTGWSHLSLPSGGATLFYPPSLRQTESDPGTVTAEQRDSAGNVIVYLNATPRQGLEELGTWPSFRVGRLRDESAVSVKVLATQYHLAFRGGSGTCVVDDYVTRVKHHEYREIACYVVGPRAASVVVAAARASAWTHDVAELQRVVAAYTVR